MHGLMKFTTGKVCAECSQPYTISSDEERLHKKICESFSIGSFPLPTLCRGCRLQRKMAWRNERYLHHRTCDACQKSMLSVYPKGTPFPVYERSCWWGDSWDAASHGRAFDFSRPFFEQYRDLLHVVPRQALNLQKSENCDYCNFAFESRNCYLCQCCYNSESLLYSYWLLECKDCIDCSYCFSSERCIQCTDCNHGYNCFFCVLSHTCTDCTFLYDCRGCTACFGCVGLRRKSYCLFNEQLTKEKYMQRLQEFDPQNPLHLSAIKKRMNSLKAEHPHLFSVQEKTEHCTGDYIFESKDCMDCFQIYRSHDCINVQDAESKDALDCYHPGWSELTYETYSSVSIVNSAFSVQCWTGNDVYYSDNCQSCSYCFGCISLRNKKYCILNKQYSKEEYDALIPRIRKHMEKSGEWGLFFPIALSPFPYNESMAQVEFPLLREEVEKRGWEWAPETGTTTGKETTIWDRIPARIADVPSSITQEILACTLCKKNYKIIPQELARYKDASLLLPQQCPDCRFMERLKTRNPRKLWSRKCAKCGKGIETTYSPDRPEIVYCEECYLKQVY